MGVTNMSEASRERAEMHDLVLSQIAQEQLYTCNDKCPDCSGSGLQPNGKGQSLKNQVTGEVKEFIPGCNQCNGTGKVVECPGCDGEGSLMYQWAKQHALRIGGAKRMMPDPKEGFYYIDSQGRSLPMKTIGGDCAICQGKGLIPKGELTK